MKIVNSVKLREEFDYENLCRKLETQVEQLTMEVDRQQKFRANDQMAMEKKLRECQTSFTEAERSIVARSEVILLTSFVLLLRLDFYTYAFSEVELVKQGILMPSSPFYISSHSEG